MIRELKKKYKEKKKIEKINNISEECYENNKSVLKNFIMHSYKICDSCKISKTIFPI